MKDDQRWVDSIYKAVDSQDVEALLAFITPDGGFGFGGAVQARGHDEIREFLNGFYGMIDGIGHTIDRVIRADEEVIARGVVTYSKGGESVSTGFMVSFMCDDDLVDQFSIYVDGVPLGQLLATS